MVCEAEIRLQNGQVAHLDRLTCRAIGAVVSLVVFPHVHDLEIVLGH